MRLIDAEKIKTVVENKDYIKQLVNTVAKTMTEAFKNLKIEDVNMFQLVYNKAIDDFLNNLYKNNLYKIGEHRDFDWEDMYKLAERLKEGAGIGTDNQ